MRRYSCRYPPFADTKKILDPIDDIDRMTPWSLLTKTVAG